MATCSLLPCSYIALRIGDHWVLRNVSKAEIRVHTLMQTSKPANVRGHECRYIECADHSIWFRCLLRSYQSLHRVEHANWFLPLSHVLFLGRVFKSINFTQSCQISFNRKHQLLCEQIAISDSQEQMSLSSTFLVSIVPFKKQKKTNDYSNIT